MNINDLVSVIVPIYNSEKYLEETLESLRQQTYTKFEALLIDDGATDKSGIIADTFSEKDQRFHVIHVKNGGVSKARNIGLDHALGEWIYCLDSDDCMEPTMLERMIKCSKGSQMVVASIAVEEIQKNTIRQVVHENVSLNDREQISSYLTNMQAHEKDLLLNYLWNRIMKRDLIESAHLRFDETVTLGEDFLFICKFLGLCNNITLIDDVLYHYYIRGNASLVGRFDRKEHSRRLKMRNELKELLTSFDIYDRAFPAFAKNEGRYSIYGIEKVNLDSCSLSRKEKRAFIQDFLSDEDIELMELYLCDAPSKSNMIWKILIRIKSATLINLYLSIKKYLSL